MQELTKEQQALNLLIQAADLAPLPGPQRRQWEEAAKVLMDHLMPKKEELTENVVDVSGRVIRPVTKP